MQFPSSLIPGRLVSRYKRFFADVELEDGTTVTAHCPNPGAMLGLKEPGLSAFLSESDNPKRKLRYTLELIEVNDFGQTTLVGINTGHPNRLVEEAILDGTITELSGYPTLRREVKYGASSRVDILLEGEDRPCCYVEVKNVHLLRQPGLVEFPDSVTSRGAKHLVELGEMVDQGHRAVMVFLVQRADGDRLEIARDIDPAYGMAFDTARDRGVEMLAYRCALETNGIHVTDPISVKA